MTRIGPPRASAFTLEVRIARGYPPDGAAELSRKNSKWSANLPGGRATTFPFGCGAHLWYHGRRSYMPPRTDYLGVLYDAMDEIHGDQDLAEDQKLGNRTKSQRHRVRKHLRARGKPD